MLLAFCTTALAGIWLLVLFLRRPSPTNPDAITPIESRHLFPPKTTFRLQGIPAFVSAQPVSKENVVQLLKNAWRIDDGVAVTVHSLATDPSDESRKIATLSFQPSPQSISPPEKIRTRPLPVEAEGSEELTLDVEFLGLTPLHREPDADCTYDIVALSGLNGHPFGSFKQRGDESIFMWLRDALPRDLSRAGVHARILIYGYDCRLIKSDSFEEISDLGSTFERKIVQLTQDATGSVNRNLILLGHSLGGILVKQAIISLNKSAHLVHENRTLERLYGLMFFGTPSQGMDIETLLPMVDGQPNELFIRTLGPSSSVLRDQMGEFRSLFELKNFSAFWYYETKESPTAEKCHNGEWKMKGPKRRLVDISSATNGMPHDYGRHMVRAINKSHSEMVKFHGPTDEVYKQVLADLKAITAFQRSGL